jgi:hypothetical protein
LQVKILKVPPDKPPKWDAADAVEEGLNIHEILKNWDRVVAKDKPIKPDMIPLYSVADLRADHSPMPEDLISPRVLTLGGILVFGGAPKVGKSDFLISLLANMAAGESFIGLSSKRPLRVFYLQAEVQYHYLRERIQRLCLPEETLERLQQNFVMTPQVRFILNDDGIDKLERKNIIASLSFSPPIPPPSNTLRIGSMAMISGGRSPKHALTDLTILSIPSSFKIKRTCGVMTKFCCKRSNVSSGKHSR